jgi:hypothetical protein
MDGPHELDRIDQHSRITNHTLPLLLLIHNLLPVLLKNGPAFTTDKLE